ncbi:uncharacterized protein LOC124157193 isoform X2 [Ischnura elegans]|uniref:uncharacterized protein LOC124157193 isoform X2 n=1 Tax=Ischnura elegans TaxID=197161 RepID=UPI001ED895E8|nr:uncharacterized protein LOC124157193 isoform X2 [Ischnura elegans]
MSLDFAPVITIGVAFLIFLLFTLCLCYCCPCCLWNKRRNQGTVYHSVTQTVIPATAIQSTNAAGLPVTQHIVVSGGVHSAPYVQPGAYPVQQTIPVGYVIPAATSPSMPPPHTGAMPMPMGQPPPYSEVMQMQGASGGISAQEAYSKQAAFNPHFNQGGP